MTVPPLSILDLAPVPSGGSAADALRHTIELARLAERSGYRRYWVAEHHLVPGVASSSTPVLVALIAAATERIRVGSGAVQLPGTPPLFVAEQFGTVAHLHPGRIDVGLGRLDIAAMLARRAGGRRPDPPPARIVDGLPVPAPPSYPVADLTVLQMLAACLGITPGEPSPDYGRQVDAIADLFAGRVVAPDGRSVVAHPAHGADVELWVLGSGAGESARVAAARGLPFAVGYHIAPSDVLDAVAAYRDAFRASPAHPRPYLLVSADVVVAPSEARAQELAAPYGQWVLDIRAGRGAQPYVTPVQARARVWTDEERAAVADRVDTQIVGPPRTVVERLATLARVTGADELMVTTITTDHADRLASTELLARAWAERAAAAA